MGVPEILAAPADGNRRKILTRLGEGRIPSGELAQAVLEEAILWLDELRGGADIEQTAERDVHNLHDG